jgi:hypothetical protein
VKWAIRATADLLHFNQIRLRRLSGVYRRKGQRFDPAYLHQRKQSPKGGCFFVGENWFVQPLTSCISIKSAFGGFPAFTTGKVSGSIPLISTTRSLETLVFQGFFHARAT